MSLHPRLQRAADWLNTHKTWLTVVLIVAVLIIAGIALREILKGITWRDIHDALRDIRPHQIALSILLTTLSYFVLTGYDVLALDTIGKRLPYWRAALGSFSAYCFSHNFGFAPVTGTAARLRAYSGTSLLIADVVRIVVIAGFTFWLGVFLLLGVILTMVPGALRVSHFSMPFGWQSMIGLVILAAIAIYIQACRKASRPLNILGWTLPIPHAGQITKQFVLAATDIAVASAALLVLLPPGTWHHYPDFLVAYTVAIVVALLAHTPGGIGVFESVILVTLPEVSKPDLVSALILYRIIYYWLPLLADVVFLGLHELRLRRIHKKMAHGAK